ncbi:MAG TPA: GxxExxY protein [Acidobacteriota bacterium]|jgi:GxxExxY protein
MSDMNHGEHWGHGDLKEASEALISTVLDAVTNVHKALGPGLLESVYERAVIVELALLGIPAQSQVPILVRYRGHELGLGFRADILVADSLLLELKCVEQIQPIHLSQVITYLKLLRVKRGFLINFNKRLIKEGIKRVSI